MTGAERFELSSLPATPWKNGGGTTREIATHPPGAGFGDFAWRLSVADVERDGPFSAFPGVDRTIVLLRGAGMRLAGNGVEHALTECGAPFAFVGEAAIEARLVGGATRDFNAMTRRGSWRAEVASLRASACVGSADAMFLWCGAGRWQVGASRGFVLEPDQAALWRTAPAAMPVSPSEPDGGAWLLAVRLCQDRT